MDGSASPSRKSSSAPMPTVTVAAMEVVKNGLGTTSRTKVFFRTVSIHTLVLMQDAAVPLGPHPKITVSQVGTDQQELSMR